MADMIDVRKGQAPEPLEKDAFGERFREQFYDPRFDEEASAIERLRKGELANLDEELARPRPK